MSLTTEEIQAAGIRLTVKWSKYIPVRPWPAQLAFLMLPHLEALFGGAAGPGKSTALLMGALQYVDVPNYAALIIRKNFKRLEAEGGLIPKSHQWLGETDARYNSNDHKWTFPSGATLSFGHLEHSETHYDYGSTEYQYIGVDEATEIPEEQYRFLFSRLRRLVGFPVPLRMRAASNPVGEYKAYIKRRFIDEGANARDELTDEPQPRAYIPANLYDNPALDVESYLKSLSQLNAVDRERLIKGDWTLRDPGMMFDRTWFKVLKRVPIVREPDGTKHSLVLDQVRYWDLAGTEVKPGEDPDWTAGAWVGRSEDGRWFIRHVIRRRGTPKQTRDLVRHTADSDGENLEVWIEQDPGQAGKDQVRSYRVDLLPDRTVRKNPPTGSKATRAARVAAAAEEGDVYLIAGEWNTAFLDEAEAFPSAEHDDMIDAVSGAFAVLGRRAGLPGAGPDIFGGQAVERRRRPRG